MYSVVLMLSMTSAPADPQGILFNRGCDGGGLRASVRASVRATVTSAGARVRAVVREHPQPLRNLAGGLTARQPVRGFFARVFARGGCGGTYSSAGGVSASINVQAGGALPMPAAEAPSRAVPPEVGGPLLDALQRRRVATQLKKALATSNSPAAKRALVDADVFNATVAKVHKDLDRQVSAVGGTVGRLGDGTLLQKIIDNLPAILDAVERIIKLFG